MIYLDTHIALWLANAELDKMSKSALEKIRTEEIRISPIIRLEIQYLNEIKRISSPPDPVIEKLSDTIGLSVCDQEFNSVVSKALEITWTRDPFDRLIVAHAAIKNDFLITADRNIQSNYRFALG